MLGQPLFLLSPVVVGVRFHNALPVGTTATDLVLTLTEMLRKHGVVNKFVEFCGAGLGVDDRRRPRHPLQHGARVRRHRVASSRSTRAPSSTCARPAAMRSTSPSSSATHASRGCSAPTMETPVFSETLDLDLASIVPSVAGPRRPQDRVALPGVWSSFTAVYGGGGDDREQRNGDLDSARRRGRQPRWRHGNPGAVPAAAGNGHSAAARRRLRGHRRDHLVHQHLEPVGDARRGAAGQERGRARAPCRRARQDLAGPRVARGDRLPAPRRGARGSSTRSTSTPSATAAPRASATAARCRRTSSRRIESEDLAVAAVLSGNRNFEGRIHPQVRPRTSRRRRWWSRTRSPARRHRPHYRAARPWQRRRRRLPQ